MEQPELGLPPIRPTISWGRGDATVRQCSWCGTVVYVPRPGERLGDCPACGTREWWTQSLPVGPFA